MNDKCIRAVNYGQGGYHQGCGRFLLIYGAVEHYFDTFSYDAKDGVIRFGHSKEGSGGLLDIKHNIVNVEGRTTKLTAESGAPLQVSYIWRLYLKCHVALFQRE